VKHPWRVLALVAGGSVCIALTPLSAGLVVGGVGSFGSSCTSSVATGTAANNLGLDQAILHDASSNNQVNIQLALSMFEGSWLESGWSNTAEGGGAFGPFQIQDPGVVNQGVTIAQAEDPAFATNYMLPRYVNALNTVNPALWSSDPERAAEQVAYAAEKPLQDYYVYRGTATVDAAFAASIQVMQKLGVSTNFGASQVSVAGKGTAVGECSTTLPNVTGLRLAVLQAAASQLGVPYVWGGTSPRTSTFPGAFDCSGLVLWSFEQAGFTNFPRVSSAQWDATKSHTVTTNINQLGQAQPGDLVFFASVDGTMTAPGHIGIYLGNGMMLDAPQTGQLVQVQTVAGDASLGFVGITDPYFMPKK
jgi:cell wall-associated NlpC family hydrolase